MLRGWVQVLGLGFRFCLGLGIRAFGFRLLRASVWEGCVTLQSHTGARVWQEVQKEAEGFVSVRKPTPKTLNLCSPG